ncbi:MAG: hypothetical protein AB8F74_06055 [Saprospiraceae bacterium]
MKSIYTTLIRGWCLLISVAATAHSTPHFPNAITPCSFYSLNLLVSEGNEDPVDNLFTDSLDDDKDGIINSQDCAPKNPSLPGTPGATCDDNNEFTVNDKIQKDGCTCIGTTILRDTPITIDLGEDRIINTGESVTITTSVLQYNTCVVTTCKDDKPLIAHWDLNNSATSTGDNQITNIAELDNVTDNSSFCAAIATSGFTRGNANLPLYSTSSHSKQAKKAVMVDAAPIKAFKNNHPQSLKFEITVDPTADVSRITRLTFMEKAPKQATTGATTKANNIPSKYGLRILKGGKEIYKSIDMRTNEKWSKALYDFSNEPIFEVSSTTVFTVELLAYSPADTEAGDSYWNIDDIKMYGGCCNTTSFQSSKYLWSNGFRTNSITVNEPGSYMVTVTDCNGTTAVDEVVVDQN